MVKKATEKLNRTESVTEEAMKVESVAEPSIPVKKEKVVECKVLYWNKYNTNFAFEYEGKSIQITLKEPLKECGKTVKVKRTNGKYELV